MLISCTFSFWHYKFTHTHARTTALIHTFSLQLRSERKNRGNNLRNSTGFYLRRRQQRQHNKHMCPESGEKSLSGQRCECSFTVVRRIYKRSKILLTHSEVLNERTLHDASEMLYGKNKRSNIAEEVYLWWWWWWRRGESLKNVPLHDE